MNNIDNGKVKKGDLMNMVENEGKNYGEKVKMDGKGK